MTGATTWRGRRGSVLLGPTEDRVARYLVDRTRHGRVRLRTSDLAAALGIERSEAYRITARLRVLGLFGIADDRSGQRGGRLWWRTAIEHDGPGLDARRHREAWARILGWARARLARVRAALAAVGDNQQAADDPGAGTASDASQPAGAPVRRPGGAQPVGPPPTPLGGGPTFEERMRRHGLGPLIDSWKAERAKA